MTGPNAVGFAVGSGIGSVGLECWRWVRILPADLHVRFWNPWRPAPPRFGSRRCGKRLPTGSAPSRERPRRRNHPVRLHVRLDGVLRSRARFFAKCDAWLFLKLFLLVLYLASVRDDEVDAKRFNGHTAFHHRREGKRTILIDRIPVPSNEVQDFARLVAAFRGHGSQSFFACYTKKKKCSPNFFSGLKIFLTEIDKKKVHIPSKQKHNNKIFEPKKKSSLCPSNFFFDSLTPKEAFFSKKLFPLRKKKCWLIWVRGSTNLKQKNPPLSMGLHVMRPQRHPNRHRRS